MPKPILVITVPSNTTLEHLIESKKGFSDSLKEEYHIIVQRGPDNNSSIQVFFEKDQIELNKEKLEKLLSLCEK